MLLLLGELFSFTEAVLYREYLTYPPWSIAFKKNPKAHVRILHTETLATRAPET